MMRRLMPAFLLLALLSAAAVQAKERMVQQWTPTPASVLRVDTRTPTGTFAAERVVIEKFMPDIRFDPRDLDNSQVVFHAFFMPVALPGNQVIDDQTRTEASSVFISEKIEKDSPNAFKVHGDFRMNGRRQPLIFIMNVVPAPGETRPVLVFSGQYNAPAGHMAPRFGIPAQIPVSFHVETLPAP